MPRKHKLIESEERFFAEARRAVQDRKEGRRTEPLTKTSFQGVAALLTAIVRKLRRC